MLVFIHFILSAEVQPKSGQCLWTFPTSKNRLQKQESARYCTKRCEWLFLFIAASALNWNPAVCYFQPSPSFLHKPVHLLHLLISVFISWMHSRFRFESVWFCFRGLATGKWLWPLKRDFVCWRLTLCWLFGVRVVGWGSCRGWRWPHWWWSTGGSRASLKRHPNASRSNVVWFGAVPHVYIWGVGTGIAAQRLQVWIQVWYHPRPWAGYCRKGDEHT